jgi:PhnB protein
MLDSGHGLGHGTSSVYTILTSTTLESNMSLWEDKKVSWPLSIYGISERLASGTTNHNQPETQTAMSTTINDRIVQPYLFFDGRCEEALEFYRKALDAEVTTLLRFKDSPDPTMCVPGSDNKVMHASFRIGETTVMASDGRCGGQPNFQGFALSLSVPTETEADRRFTALEHGGQVQMPLAKTFFSPRFGMVADRFGVSWMIIVAPGETGAKQN